MKYLLVLTSLLSFNVLAAPVNVNKADANAIAEALNGIGQKKAEAIVKFRQEHGNFKSLNDLQKVKGIGEKTAMQNKQDILFKDIKVSKK